MTAYPCPLPHLTHAHPHSLLPPAASLAAPLPSPNTQAPPTLAERRRFWWGHPAYWWCQLVVWVGNMGVSISGSVVAPQKEVPGALHPILLAFLFSTLTTVLTHIYRWVILSGHWKEWRLPRLIPRAVLASLCCGMVLAGLSLIVDHRTWTAENMGWGMADLLTVWLFVHFLAWSAAYFGWHYYGQLQEARLQKLRLDMAAKEAALASLRSQVNPPFLFNGLNTLRSLIDTDPARARTMVTQLAKIFRASLASGSTQLVPAQEELETVEAHLLIEKTRFEENLDITATVTPGLEHALLPPSSSRPWWRMPSSTARPTWAECAAWRMRFPRTRSTALPSGWRISATSGKAPPTPPAWG